MNYGIQILRALACVMIFLCHTNDYLHVTRQLGLGEFGVCIFIMLSGFLKTAYSPKKAEGRKPEPIIYNLKRRFRKIYPLHLFMTIIAVPLVLLEVQEGTRSVINSILSFVLNVLSPVYGPSPCCIPAQDSVLCPYLCIHDSEPGSD